VHYEGDRDPAGRLAVASCDDYHSNKDNKPGVAFEPLLSPSPAITAHILPSPLPIVTIPAIGCPVCVLHQFRRRHRLNGPQQPLRGPCDIPASGRNECRRFNRDDPDVRAQLDVRIDLFLGSRTFPFRPQFGCQTNRPFAIAGDIRLVDSSGVASNVTVSATF
jgi:hypothetical protein